MCECVCVCVRVSTLRGCRRTTWNRDSGLAEAQRAAPIQTRESRLMRQVQLAFSLPSGPGPGSVFITSVLETGAGGIAIRATTNGKGDHKHSMRMRCNGSLRGSSMPIELNATRQTSKRPFMIMAIQLSTTQCPGEHLPLCPARTFLGSRISVQGCPALAPQGPAAGRSCPAVHWQGGG